MAHKAGQYSMLEKAVNHAVAMKVLQVIKHHCRIHLTHLRSLIQSLKQRTRSRSSLLFRI